MLKHIEEFGKYVAIAGFRGAKVRNVEKFLMQIRNEKPSDIEVQVFDAEVVATWQHLYFATLNALTRFRKSSNISNNLAMEIMLFASAQHQIQKATQIVGIKADSSSIAILILGEKSGTAKSYLARVTKNIDAQQDDGVLEISEKKMKAIQKIFGISDAELETVTEKGNLKKALVDLVIERVALLATHG